MLDSLTDGPTEFSADIDVAWLESLHDDTTLRPVAEDAGVEFPTDSPPRFAGDLAVFND